MAHAPMTPQELERIRERAEKTKRCHQTWTNEDWQLAFDSLTDIPTLLREVERLAALVERGRPHVRYSITNCNMPNGECPLCASAKQWLTDAGKGEDDGQTRSNRSAD